MASIHISQSQEDACLKLAISSIGLPAYQNQISWVEVAKLVPNRGAKSCRLRLAHTEIS